jgi:DNA-binding NtrC family response regulator
MSDSFDFISPTDKPALLAITTPEWLSIAETTLEEAAYKVHTITSHSEFPGRFSQVPYQVVIIEEQFAGTPVNENVALQTLQKMPMNQRRHATIILIGASYQTFNALQAFEHSVHAVVNFSEMPLLAQLVEKIVADNDLFLSNFREVQQRVAQTPQ